MLCYYVTGHGFGHAIRTTQVLKALPPDLPLILKTTAPERLFREELPGRAFEYIPAEYDCGCLQSDSVTVLPRETLTRYGQIAKSNAERLSEEAKFLMRSGVRCVASDIPSFPLLAARQAGIPGVAVGNFTWHDIYREYVETTEDSALLEHMAAEYAAATVACITPLNVPTVTEVFPHVERVPLIARKGRRIRDMLHGALEIPNGKHLALLYLGGWGLDIHWPALTGLSEWVFLVDRPLPLPLSNTRIFDPSQWRYADVAASVDTVITKAGYGTVTECIANSVPLIYLPRYGFAEHESLVLGMREWGGGIEIPEGDFLAGQWSPALAEALAAKPNPTVYATDGAHVVANLLREQCR